MYVTQSNMKILKIVLWIMEIVENIYNKLNKIKNIYFFKYLVFGRIILLFLFYIGNILLRGKVVII